MGGGHGKGYDDRVSGGFGVGYDDRVGGDTRVRLRGGIVRSLVWEVKFLRNSRE